MEDVPAPTAKRRVTMSRDFLSARMWGPGPRTPQPQRCAAAARRALQLDSSLAEPHAALGFYHMYYGWDWSTADQEFRKAIALNPRYATGHEWYGLYLAVMGRFRDALAEVKRVKELDELSVPSGVARRRPFHPPAFVRIM
jgi:hypothetical protein